MSTTPCNDRLRTLAYEAMECIGGNGVMENSIMPRLYRERGSTPSGTTPATSRSWTPFSNGRIRA